MESENLEREVALGVVRDLREKGFEAFLVGGAVRDRLLGLEAKDFDVVTSATVEQMGLFLGAKPVKSHAGAPTAVLHGVEVTSFRKETGDRRKAAFEPATAREDALRRDFTLNTLLEGLDGEVVEPLKGALSDLEARRLVFVGDGASRVAEDPTRALRAYRLAAAKGLKLPEETRGVLRATAGELERLAPEQVGRELTKLLTAESSAEVGRALRMMAEDGVLGVVLPEVDNLRGVAQNRHHLEGDAFEHTMRVVEATPNGSGLVLRFAALLHDVGKAHVQKLKGN